MNIREGMIMNYETRDLQMKVAELLHEHDGCEPTPFDQCPRKGKYVTKAAFFLGKLMPTIIREVVVPTRRDEDQRIAQRIRAELVCCDITQRMSAEAAKGRWDDENGQYLMPQSWRDLKSSHDFHPICFYGGWAMDIAKDGVGRRYWCSQGGEFELNEGGGFQTCCDNPEGHIFMSPDLDGEDEG